MTDAVVYFSLLLVFGVQLFQLTALPSPLPPPLSFTYAQNDWVKFDKYRVGNAFSYQVETKVPKTNFCTLLGKT